MDKDLVEVLIPIPLMEKFSYFPPKNRPNQLIRNYGIGAQIIKSLNIKNMILVTRSPKKVVGLEGFDIKIVKQEIIK